MNLYQGLNQMMEYIEKNIEEDISMDTLAKFLGCSSYTMQRIFSMMVGFSIKEYIKKRRFSLAVISLMEGKKVIDVALSFGYTSPTAFSRKFYEIYHIHPKDVKNKKIDFILQPILTFDPKEYDHSVNYRIEKTKKSLFYGKKIKINNTIPKEAEKFWNKMKKDYPDILNNLPRYAVIEEGNVQSFYWILLKQQYNDLEPFYIPEGTWLVFTENSFHGKDISKLCDKIYYNYLKSISKDTTGNYTLELYYEDYMEVWVRIN